jgi:uncharacterized protein (DUF433 family)
MTSALIEDRGRGPEISGTRITVYNLLPYFLDATATEEEICRINELTPQQVSAARAYVLNHPDTLLAEHLKIEERIAAGNPPEMKQWAERAKETFLRFRDWLAQKERAEAESQEAEPESGPLGFPRFREWIAERDGKPGTREMPGLLAELET